MLNPDCVRLTNASNSPLKLIIPGNPLQQTEGDAGTDENPPVALATSNVLFILDLFLLCRLIAAVEIYVKDALCSVQPVIRSACPLKLLAFCI
jgi:hypothetical protein